VRKRRRWRLSTRIVASQVGVLLVVAALALWLNIRLSGDQLDQQFEHRSLAVAQTVADLPQVVAALSGTGPKPTVQQIALRIDHTTGAAFVVVVNRAGIRLSSPDPALVGKWFHEPVVSLDGRDHLRIDPGKPAPSANARAPVFSSAGSVIGEVSVGFLERQVTAAAWGEIPLIAGASGISLLLGVVVSLLLARRLKRITFGLELEEIADLLGEVEKTAATRESLRRVATLVANEAPMEQVFSAIAEETARLAGADEARICRYASDGSQELVAAWGNGHECLDVSGVPIVVNGQPWGLIVVAATAPEPKADDIEGRIAAFAELAATAISNSKARADLAASRKRVVAAADESRRKIERNLHDGTQQRLVTLGLELRNAHDSCPGLPDLKDQLSHMTEEVAGLLDELREISHGVHPAVLSQAGLGPALRSLARRAPLPVRVGIDVPGRLPEQLEVAAYYVVSEALTNAAKHSDAAAAEVTVTVGDGSLRVRVSDKGTGGADEAKGSGIVGLRDRVEALGGTMTLSSPAGAGTTLRAELPIPGSTQEPRRCPGAGPAEAGDDHRPYG
jgi:signal transduction histidine kinase